MKLRTLWLLWGLLFTVLWGAALATKDGHVVAAFCGINILICAATITILDAIKGRKA